MAVNQRKPLNTRVSQNEQKLSVENRVLKLQLEQKSYKVWYQCTAKILFVKILQEPNMISKDLESPLSALNMHEKLKFFEGVKHPLKPGMVSPKFGDFVPLKIKERK